MQGDVVHEACTVVEEPVSLRLKPVEGEADELKLGSMPLSDGVKERLGKLERLASDPVPDSARTRCADALKEWTGKARETIVFDSTVDEFTYDGLFEKIKGKPNIAIVATTTDGDVFGGFYSVAVTEQGRSFFDPSIFIFSFESHGRCMTPQRFVLKEENRKYASVLFYKKDFWSGRFVVFDGYLGHFFLGNEKSRTICADLSQGFEGIDNTTLTGKENNGAFTCCRLVAIQLE